MLGRTCRKRFSWLAVIAVTCSGFSLAAEAQTPSPLPADPCDATEWPAAIETIAVTPDSKQPQINWQREGRGLKIPVDATRLPANARAVACFRWLLDSDSPDGPQKDKFKKFVQSPVQIPAAAPTPATPATAAPNAATTPRNSANPERPAPAILFSMMPAFADLAKSTGSADPPEPRSNVGKDKIAGVFSSNRSYQLVEVRVLVFGTDAKPAAIYASSIGIVGADNYCDVPGLVTTTDSGSGSVATDEAATGRLMSHKNWQPVGGQFDFTVVSSKEIPRDALVKVCFRWKLRGGEKYSNDPGRFFESGPTHLISGATQPRTVKIAATVPEILCRPGPARGADDPEPCPKSDKPTRADYAVAGLAVPHADARILVFDSDNSPIVDVVTTVGITRVWFAQVAVVVTVGLVLFVLFWVCRHRLPNWCNTSLLCVITTRRGFASLSQFQIILWTFVVLASAVYVMALSGDLIDITSGTLGLLGISGAAALVSKQKSESDAARPDPTLDPVATTEAAITARYEAKELRDKVAVATDEAARKEAISAAEEAEAKADAAEATAEVAKAVAAATKARMALANATTDDEKQKARLAIDAADNDADAKKLVMAAAVAKADKATRVRHPRLSDLVMEEVKGRELDVTRVQMLIFTVVTAAFVLLSVASNYVIPEIPTSFLYLMGISNGVYVGSKFATNPNAK